MSFDPKKTTPSSDPTVGKSGIVWLRYRESELELRPGRTVIGRSAACQIVLDDGLVSRRHAILNVAADGVTTLEDLGSVNGVFINGDRVTTPRRVGAGDRVVIGKQELLLCAGPRGAGQRDSTTDSRRTIADTMSGLDPHVPQGLRDPDPTSDTLDDDDAAADVEATRKGDAIELLGGLADKVLALGRGDEAERLLGTFLQNVLASARGGQSIDVDFAERAATYAVKLAGATKKGLWVDYAVEMYIIVRKPLPAAVVDRLYDVLRSVSAINLARLREYVALLHSFQHRFGPAERFLAQRIEGLERIAALR